MMRALLLSAMLVCGTAHAESRAVSSAVGVALGAAALHSGAGEHPAAPVGGAWGRLAVSDACYVEAEAAGSWWMYGGSLANFDQRWARGALSLGCSAGTRATRVAASLGPAVSLRSTGIDAQKYWRANSVQPGLRYRMGFLVPVGERWQVDILMGGSTHGWVFDHDLLLQGGVRW